VREAESCQLVVRVQRICTSAEAKRIGWMEDGTGMAGFGVFADCRLQVVGWFLPSSVLSQSARLLPRFGVGLAFGAFGAFQGFQGLSVQRVHGCPLSAAWRQKPWKLEVTWKCPGREAWTCCGCAVPEVGRCEAGSAPGPTLSGESAANSPGGSGWLQGANRRDRAEHREQKLVRATSGRLAGAQQGGEGERNR
jgi:hypothetical protein